MGRAPCCDKAIVKKGPWSPEEDAKLKTYIEQNGTGNWIVLLQRIGLKRCGKSCRLRWLNYLRPNIQGASADQLATTPIVSSAPQDEMISSSSDQLHCNEFVSATQFYSGGVFPANMAVEDSSCKFPREIEQLLLSNCSGERSMENSELDGYPCSMHLDDRQPSWDELSSLVSLPMTVDPHHDFNSI